MTASQIEKAWRAGKADTVYFFYGEEEFLRDELIRKSVDLLLPDAALRSFNLDEFDGIDATLGEVLSSARAYPVMAESRLVICRNTEKLFTARSDERKQEENEAIGAYLDDPNRSTVLILDSSKPGAKNTHPWKGLHAKSTAVGFDALKERDAIEWINERCEKYAKHLDTRAAQMLVSLIGTDLRALSNELEKIITYVGDADQITTADVEASVGVSPTYNVFNLTKAIGLRNKALATEIAIKMFEADKKAFYLTMLGINRYFEQIVVARELVSNKASEAEIIKALDLYGGAAYYVKDYINAARGYSRAQLDNAIRALVRTEYQTRKTSIDDSLLVENLIAEIIPTV
ncbi:MAG TPA: DNA polymerase III subunit delta [Candidatus Kapabacteria bacterium]|nr:DNA polymerase III subunit delta [Candidatus Kapabacteria bacterium]